jgi:hypothetical protein
LNNLAKYLKQLPAHDRIYPDCPHDTAIIIVVTYVDDNLVFTNCETMRQQFADHCNKRVRFNDEGPTRWYLGTQYDRNPITGTVSPSQELYINKLLTHWHMSDCNPTKIPCSTINCSVDVGEGRVSICDRGVPAMAGDVVMSLILARMCAMSSFVA